MTKVLTAAQVVRDEQGQEVILTFGKAPAPGAPAAATMPKYLDDDDDAHLAAPIDAKSTLARPGDAGGLTSWLSKGIGFISKSLYW
jgi:armadillo repeat-containing protein 1